MLRLTQQRSTVVYPQDCRRYAFLLDLIPKLTSSPYAPSEPSDAAAMSGEISFVSYLVFLYKFFLEVLHHFRSKSPIIVHDELSGSTRSAPDGRLQTRLLLHV